MFVLKTSWRHLQDMSCRCLENGYILARRLQYVLEDKKMLCWRLFEDKQNVYWVYLYLKTLFDLIFAIPFFQNFNNFFIVKITKNICPRINIFDFLSHKNVFRPSLRVTFYIFFLYSDILTWSPTLILGFSSFFLQ